MSYNIYDCEQHIDYKKIETLLADNNDKEIICFGGGTAAQILMDKLLCRYNVTMFLDNNKKLWDTEIFGKKIVEPNVLANKDKNTYIVLILSKHAVEISKQLEDLGLERDVNFFDIYKEFATYFRIKKFQCNVEKFLSFIDRIPKDSFKNISVKKGEKSAIICSGSMAKNAVCYAIGQCLVSMYHGYDATLVVDTMKGFDDYIYFSDYHQVVKVYIDYIVDYIRNSGINIKVEYVTQCDKAYVTDEEDNQLDYLSQMVLAWLDSRKDEVFVPDMAERVQLSKDILVSNYGYIKQYFQGKEYDVISVFTGMHKHRCLYALIAKNMHMRLSSYDGGETGHEIKVSCDGISTHSPDIKKIINNNMFSQEERDVLLVQAKELLAQRQGSTVSDNKNLKTRILNYQIVPRSDDVEEYDILVPLNIFWDSAALWVDKVFYNWIEWLKELINYIYYRTNATMMIREHPAQHLFSKFKYVDLQEAIGCDLSELSDRIRFVKADEKLNTYSYMNKTKLILPYTSTLGLEAAIMGKPVIMHTDIYYSGTDFAPLAATKEEYFQMIDKALSYKVNEYQIRDKDKEDALLMYFLKMKDMLPTAFTEAIGDWMEYEFDDLCSETGVNRLMECIYHNIPVCYNRMKELLK